MKVLGAMVMEIRATLRRFSMVKMDMTRGRAWRCLGGMRVTRDSSQMVKSECATHDGASKRRADSPILPESRSVIHTSMLSRC